MSSATFLRNGEPTSSHVLLLAHGAGAGMDTEFMDTIAQGIAKHSVAVIRFEFLYMQRIRELGKKRPPDSAPKLLAHFVSMIGRVKAELDPHQRLWVGGKSMGGRVASMVATKPELELAGCICFGYPFHPPGRPERLRVDHFQALHCPTLIIQGTRDPFGKPEEDVETHLSEAMSLRWLDSGDHSLKARKKDLRSTEEQWTEAARWAASFMQSSMVI